LLSSSVGSRARRKRSSASGGGARALTAQALPSEIVVGGDGNARAQVEAVVRDGAFVRGRLGQGDALLLGCVSVVAQGAYRAALHGDRRAGIALRKK